ncbi:glycosyltransferase [Cystobacter fuscus]|nr:glycosyltransferase [Cystobacter fuscus]
MRKSVSSNGAGPEEGSSGSSTHAPSSATVSSASNLYRAALPPMFNPLAHPLCLSAPRWRGAASDWTEHVPFALSLVDLARPRLIVELGTRSGESYAAFCQAVEDLKLPSTCYAVGAWPDEHAPELQSLRAQHDPLYGGFSRLLVGSRQGAHERFEKGSIDLLHVCALDGDESSRRVLEDWLPRMSSSGLVLFHGINQRESDTGMWKQWSELAIHHPHFTFAHGQGLGLLAVGAEPPEGVRFLLEARPVESARIKSFFFGLGSRLVLQSQAELAREAQTKLADERQQGEKLREELKQVVQRNTQADALLRARNLTLRLHEEELRHLKEELRTARMAHDHQGAAMQQKLTEITALRDSLNTISASISWRLVNRYWAARERVLPPGTRRGHLYQLGKRTLQRVLLGAEGPRAGGPLARGQESAPAARPVPPSQLERGAQYALWLERNTLTEAQLARLRTSVRSFEYQPLISIVTPVYNVDEVWLRRAIKSVIQQIYPNWELCLVDDGSTRPHILPLLREYEQRESRIKVIHQENGGISAASNAGLKLAQGEFVALMDHDDELSPDALYSVVQRLNQTPDEDVLYSDEDKLDARGKRVEPFFKPDWSPELLLSMNYLCHFTVVRKRLLEEVGGFRSAFDGSQDYDLFLRLSERTKRIAHIPKVLYHWRIIPQSAASSLEAKPYAHQAAKKALEEALERRGRPGTVTMAPSGAFSVRYKLEQRPLVSIIIPTKDKVELLRQCVLSIQARSSYTNYELVVVDNNSTEPETFRFFKELPPPHRVLRDTRPFNWAAINNSAAEQAQGEYLLFLNNDVEVIDPDWLEAMLELAQWPEMGAVGAKLLFPNDTLQHAGVVMGIGGVANHAFKHLGAEQPGYFNLAQVIRDYSAVTGACMMVRRSVFEELGGFDERLRVAFNDIDFCLRLRERGYSVVYTPHAKLYHYESATRGTLHPPEDERFMRERWEQVLKGGDPFYNPNLTLQQEDFGLRL